MSEELKFSMPIVNEIPKWVIPTWCLSEKGKRGETVATVITFGTHIEQLTKLSKKEYERGRLATIKEVIKLLKEHKSLNKFHPAYAINLVYLISELGADE